MTNEGIESMTAENVMNISSRWQSFTVYVILKCPTPWNLQGQEVKGFVVGRLP